MALAQNPSIAALSNLVLFYDASNVKSYPGAGSSIYDMSGNSNTGTLTNGPLWSAANNGTISFDGTDDYITVSDSTSLRISDSISISAWIFPTAYPNGGGGGGFIASKLTYYFELKNTGVLRSYFYGLSTEGYHDGLTTISLNKWTHVALVRNNSASTITTYVNGQIDRAITSITGTITTNSSSLQIGAYSGGGYSYFGRIANLQIYNKALSDTEVKQNYDATKGRFINTPFAPTDISGLAAWFDADDPRTLFSNTSGTTRATSDGNAVALWVDKSGSGRNASQSTASKCPTLKTNIINNRNVIRGDGSNDTLSLSRAVADDFSIFILFQTTQSYFRNSSTQWYEGAGLFDSEVGGVVNDYGLSMYQGYPRAGTGNPDTSITDPSTRNNGSPNLVCFTRLKSTGALTLYSNGITVATGTGTTASLTSPTVNYLMSTADSFGYMSGDIAEVIVYSSVLSAANRIRVEQYLQNKWGFNLGFIPTQITGLQLWLDSSDSGSLFQDSVAVIPAINDGDPVGCWKDKSGNGRNCSQSTSASRPTLKSSIQNSKNVIRFDGSNDFMNFSSITITSDMVIFCISRRLASNTFTWFSPGDQTSTNGYGATIDSANGLYAQLTSDSGYIQYGTGYTSAATYLMTTVRTSSTQLVYRNGVEQAITATNGTRSVAGTLSRLGCRVNQDFMNGDFCELLVYNAALTTAQRQQVEAYLNQKWGVF